MRCAANWWADRLMPVVHRDQLKCSSASRVKKTWAPNQRAQLDPRACLTRSILMHSICLWGDTRALMPMQVERLMDPQPELSADTHCIQR